MTSNANLILFLVSHEWATWVRSYMQREMKKGHKVLFRYHGKNIMCRVTEVGAHIIILSLSPRPAHTFPFHREVSNHPSEFGTALYTVQWPVNSNDPKEVKSKKSVPRKYLKFPLPRFPKTWADWLVNELNLYGGQAEVWKLFFLTCITPSASNSYVRTLRLLGDAIGCSSCCKSYLLTITYTLKGLMGKYTDMDHRSVTIASSSSFLLLGHRILAEEFHVKERPVDSVPDFSVSSQ